MSIAKLCLGTVSKKLKAIASKAFTQLLLHPWPQRRTRPQGGAQGAGEIFASTYRQSFYFGSGYSLLVSAVPLFFLPWTGLAETIGRQMLKVSKQREGNIIRFFVENVEAAQVTGTFELNLVNLKGSTNFPYTATFPARQKVEVFNLSVLRGDLEWSYTLTNFFTMGSHCAVHDDTVVYHLPYAPGQAFRVSQGHHGTFSHQGPEEFAIDWKMPPTTPVLAARAGRVVALKEDSNRGGEKREWESSANYVLVQHEDGTIANYAHLCYGGVQVQVGDWVEAGSLLGLSGNTGFSSGPHLHFCVFKTKNGKERESIPVKFRTESHGVTILQAGQTYIAPKTLLAGAGTATRRVVMRSEN